MDDGLFSLKIIGLYWCSLMKLIRVVEQNSLCEKKSEHQNIKFLNNHYGKAEKD